MKTIIAATDFSDSAANAVQFAAAIAAQTHSRLVLFNAFQLSVHATNSLISAAGMEEMFQSNKKDLQNLADEITFQYRIVTDIYTRNAFLQDALPAAVVEGLAAGREGQRPQPGLGRGDQPGLAGAAQPRPKRRPRRLPRLSPPEPGTAGSAR